MSFFSDLMVAVKNRTGQYASDEVSKEIFDNSPEAILIIDRDGKVIATNNRIKEWLGYSVEMLNDKLIFELPFLDENGRNIIRDKFESRFKGEEIKAYDLTVHDEDGKPFHTQVNGSLVVDSFGDVAGEIIMISDANELHASMEEERAVAEDLRYLTSSALDFTSIKSGDDIYQKVAVGLANLTECLVLVSNYDKEKELAKPMYAAFGKQNTVNLHQESLPITADRVFPSAYKAKLMKDNIVLIEDNADLSQYSDYYKSFPQLGESGKLKKVYLVAFVWKGELFGTAVIFGGEGVRFSIETISAYIYQSSIALQKFIDEAELTKYRSGLEKLVEEQTSDLEETNQDLKRFELAVMDASDHIIITDPEGKIIYANAAAEKITGYTFAQMKGKTPSLWGKQMENDFYKGFWHTINSKKPFLGEIRNKRSSGLVYWAEIHVAPVLDPQDNIIYFVGIERDITKAKEVDQAKTEFVSLASHQLRTPLSAINWYTEMLLDGDAGEITKDQENYLKEIYTGSQRMVDLVNSLLNVSRLELGTFIVEPAKAHLKDICEDVLKELDSQIKKKQQEVTTNYDSKVPEMLVDPKLTRIIFQNLLSNAVKYTPDKGKVQVSIEINPKNDKEILIQVSDTGYGIPKHQQDKIFTKLFRADNVKKMESEGTGLGVYIIKQIIDTAGGKIWFASEEDKGTTFYITIPKSGMKKREGSRELS